MKKVNTLRLLPLGLFAIVAMLGLVGCESDTVSPNDDPPSTEVTEEIAVERAVVLSMGLNEIAPVLLDPTTKEFPYTFSGEVEGTVFIEYRDGGAAGTVCVYEECDYGTMTTDGEPVVFGGVLGIEVDVTALIDPDSDTAVVNGTGAMTSGEINDTFTIDDVLLVGSDYLGGGALLLNYPAQGIEIEVAFDGTNTVMIFVGGVGEFELDLDTGVTIPIS